MASIITSIAFKNFFNYYGEFDSNEYQFKEGVNIIVADNGNGKSKFFNAFIWLFRDEILDSDTKKALSIKTAAVKILSDKAKNETSVGSIVECAVKVTYSDNRFSYEIVKSFTAQRVGESITAANDWSIYINDMEVSKKDIDLLTYHPVKDEDEKNRILNKLIQVKLRPYSLFQGEEVDKLIDFSDPQAIKTAVRTLTNIQKYDDLKDRTAYMFKRAEDSLNSKITASSIDSKRFKQIVEDIERLREVDLKIEQQRHDQYDRTYTSAKVEIETLEIANQNAEKRKEFDDKIKALNVTFNTHKEEYENLTSKINTRFFDGSFAWMAHGCKKYIDSYRKKNIDFTEKRVAYKLQKNNTEDSQSISFLPMDSPDMVTLQTMIDKHFCYICNRPAEEGTPEHNHLISLKDRPNIKSDVEIFKNDLSGFFSEIMMGAQPFISRVDHILELVGQTRLSEQETNDKIKTIASRIKDLKDKRSNLLIGDENGENDTRATMAKYRNAISQMERARQSIETSTQKIQKINKDIGLLETEKGRLQIQDVPEAYQLNYSYALDLKNATENTRNRIYTEMLDKLEKHANQHFQNLIKYNDLQGGQLKFIKSINDTIDFKYQDKNGHEVTGASEGFQRMKVLSVLMAIISISKTEYEYPLLADAPLSAFGQAFIKGFFEETTKVFPQSLLLIKDIYEKESPNKLNALGNELLNNPSVKTLYVNQIPEGLPQIEILTTKIKLK